MKKFWMIILLTFLGEGICTAQPQSRTIHERLMSHSSAMENEVSSWVYNNPAMKSLQHSTTLTTLLLAGDYQKEDLPSVVQEGDGLRMGTVEVSSFIRKNKSSLWGQASYQNGKKLGRCWNETSDFALLYPYVMGDTLGGSLKSEQYYFAGGYAHRISSYIIGVEGAYRAAIEYRNRDPRPKNLTGDLKVKLGAAKYLSDQYILGIAGYAQKYKQTNDLAFYNELGVPNIYHFTGLGTDYYRFRGAKGESFYKGHSFGGSFDLHSATPSGASASILYNNFQFDKVISSLNELPLASVKEDLVRGEVSWKQQNQQSHRWGVTGNFEYIRRRGTENIFGASSGNIFTQISAQEKYMNKIYAGRLAGVYEYTSATQWRVSVLPALSFTDIHTSHLYPEKEMKVAFLNTKMDFRIAYPVKKWLLNGELGGFCKIRNHASLDVLKGIKPGEEKLNAPIVSNFEALKSNSNGFHTTLRGDYSWNEKYSVFLSANYQYARDRRHSVSQYIGAQLGFVF